MKPIVGVMPLWDEEKESLWMLPGYMKGIEEVGAVPVMLPLTKDVKILEQLANCCDGFLFTGGQDVDPELYNEDALECVESCSKRDAMETIMLQIAIEYDKPVLGICRGIQFINVSLGGTLYQDIPTQFKTSVEHHQTPPYDIPVHEVEVLENTPLEKCLKVKKLSVNSYHHQAVKDISPELTAMAISSDGLVEAVYRKESRFLWAVQWHPEFSFETDKMSKKIFQAFVDAIS
ncbi:MAG: gamma-glutamyl-gamma-aminobutyrate hydrolase family protein [Butyrivibrio sp.]|nr:gamma-glutamyl-gamma-aminobutyrate hydrolase family protein [Butyrivibrio sp.]